MQITAITAVFATRNTGRITRDHASVLIRHDVFAIIDIFGAHRSLSPFDRPLRHKFVWKNKVELACAATVSYRYTRLSYLRDLLDGNGAGERASGFRRNLMTNRKCPRGRVIALRVIMVALPPSID